MFTGRFLSLDPIRRPPRLPAISSYAYADQRTAVLIDPSGMEPLMDEAESCQSLLSLSCIKAWGVDGLGWKGGCERSTKCLLRVELNVGMNVGMTLFPEGRGASFAFKTTKNWDFITDRLRQYHGIDRIKAGSVSP